MTAVFHMRNRELGAWGKVTSCDTEKIASASCGIRGNNQKASKLGHFAKPTWQEQLPYFTTNGNLKFRTVFPRAYRCE